MNYSDLKIGIIGYGKVGKALAWNLRDSGVQITAVSNGLHSSIINEHLPEGCVIAEHFEDVLLTADLVFLTLPDQIIGSFCETLELNSGHTVIHCSGTLESTILSSAASLGAETGVFHPLQTITETDAITEHSGVFTNVTFAITTEFSNTHKILVHLANMLDGSWITLEDHMKTPYHIAAIMACGHLTTLLDLSKTLMLSAGLNNLESDAAIKTIAEKTMHNYFFYGPKSLTGPTVRHDKDTVLKHIDWLRENQPSLIEVYTNLTHHSTKLVARTTEPKSTLTQEDQ